MCSHLEILRQLLQRVVRQMQRVQPGHFLVTARRPQQVGVRARKPIAAEVQAAHARRAVRLVPVDGRQTVAGQIDNLKKKILFRSSQNWLDKPHQMKRAKIFVVKKTV